MEKSHVAPMKLSSPGPPTATIVPLADRLTEYPALIIKNELLKNTADDSLIDGPVQRYIAPSNTGYR